MSAQSSGPTPRTSISSQPSASSSSTPYARTEGRRNREPGSFDGRVAQSHEEVEDGGEIQAHLAWADDKSLQSDIVEEQDDERHPRRQRPRHSGGFLLQTSSPSQAQDRSHIYSTRDSEVARGKRKAEDGALVVPKRDIGLRQPKSVGGSPLATEVTRNALSQEGAGDENHDRRGHSSGMSSNRQSLRSAGSDNRVSTGSRSSMDAGQNNEYRNALGHDIDPAQIVNLALNLSESRRRNTSGGSMLVPREASSGRRITSAGQQALSIPYGAGGGSLRQHMREQRRISRNISPLSGRSSGRREAGSSPKPEKRISRHASGLQPFETSVDEGVTVNASNATFARAEKARAALELNYEYRRLLQYLPAIPKPTNSRSNTSKGAGTAHAQSPSLGREYNPLQYIRNRKVRFREKKPLNPEIDGWKEVDRVRAWVNSVKSEREAGISRADDPFPLPPFDAVQDQPTVIDGQESADVKQSKISPTAKTARPKMDWTFAPWDLLADVHWMDQDHNIQRIEDRSWQRIVQDPDSYKGGPPRTSRESPRQSDVRKSASLTRNHASPDHSRDLATNSYHERHERGRIRKGHYGPSSPVHGDDESRTRKTRWPKKLLRSRSSSSSGHSDWSNQSRHRRGLNSRDNFDNAALEKHMMDMLAQEAEESRSPTKGMNGDAKPPASSPYSFTRDTKPNIIPARPSAPQRMKTDTPLATKQVASARQSLDNERFGHRRNSSEDLRTAPTSPVIPGLAPSIAVDLSPPDSPPKNTVSPSKNPFAARLGSFRRDQSRSVGERAPNEDDAIRDGEMSATVSRQVTNESQGRNRLIKERPRDDINGHLYPSKSDLPRTGSRTQDLRSARSAKDMSGPDSRFRGLFKGGRIAELVGSEVSKVGDMIWKKDGSNIPSQFASPALSHNSDSSEDDDGEVEGLDSSPSDLSRVTTNTDGLVMRTEKPIDERQKYHISNLPSFRSQYAKHDQSSALANDLPNEDHIARQQRMLKERGRSSKFDRLAPPRMDIGSISPSPSPANSRSRSRNPEKDSSRNSSASRSTRGVREADEILNNVLGIPGRVGTGKVAPTGLAAFSSSTQGQQGRGRSHPKDERQWSISDRGISAVQGTITKRDIARVRALLLSSGVKANEIARRTEEIPLKPPPLLQGLQDVIKGPVPLLPASQEFVFAARALVTDIECTNKQLRDAADAFSKDTVEGLHDQIKAVDERVNYKLTPLVRAAADDADAFSTELTTTHTLAVRQLNDAVDVILRRRRRKLRWIRRGGWALLEWAVLGIMWMVWFIVMIVHLVRGTVKGTIRGVKWLLFL